MFYFIAIDKKIVSATMNKAASLDDFNAISQHHKQPLRFKSNDARGYAIWANGGNVCVKITPICGNKTDKALIY